MGRPCLTEPNNDAALVLLLLLASDGVGERIDVVEVSAKAQKLGAHILRKALATAAPIDQEIEHVFAKRCGIVP